jgi:hypothetical protein
MYVANNYALKGVEEIIIKLSSINDNFLNSIDLQNIKYFTYITDDNLST